MLSVRNLFFNLLALRSQTKTNYNAVETVILSRQHFTERDQRKHLLELISLIRIDSSRLHYVHLYDFPEVNPVPRCDPIS